MLLVSLLGVVSILVPTVTVDAKTLSPIIGGNRTTSSGSSNAQTYSYLLNGNSNKGFLPDIKNLSKYGYANQGWGIDTPTKGSVGEGGRELVHAVFPSQTYFHKVNDVEYLRISGTAVLSKYFHHTDKNHRVAILTREDGKNNSIKLWEASLLDLTSSASHSYGYGAIDGKTDWRAAVNQSGHGLIPLHVTTNPYPLTADKASGKGTSKYFDNGYGSLFGVNAFNTNQVPKLCGLGSVGNALSDTWNTSNWSIKKQGCTYIMDYTGFVIDIPVSALVSSTEKAHKYDFNIVMTMTTPNGKDARVMGKTLHVPGLPKKNTTVIDENKGYKGAVSLAPSDLGNVKYTPDGDALRNFKRTGNFSTNHYAKDTNTNNPSNMKPSGTYGFTASGSSPRFVAWSGRVFGSGTWNEVNKNKNTADFVENKAFGRGEMWVGWSLPSLSKSKLYTSVGLAYETMPSAVMDYKPEAKVKPVVVRHRIVNNGNYRNPGEVFKTETQSVVKAKGNITAKPLTGTALTSLGSNMKYLGKSRIGGDPINDAVTNVSTSGLTLTNNQLFSKEYGGDGTLYVDFYYSGNPKQPDTNDPGTSLLTYKVEHREKGSNALITNGDKGRLPAGRSHQVMAIRPNGYVTTNEYKVNSGGVQKGSSYLISNNSDTSSSVTVVFYYEKRKMNIEVEHINQATGNKISKTETGATVVLDKTYVAKPLPANQLNGYTYSNKYKVNGGSLQTGANYTVKYNDELDKAVVTFYYNWNDPEDSTKRVQGDEGVLAPVDVYLNAGLVTKRDASGNVTGSSLEANTSAILNTYESPIAISPKGGSITVGGNAKNLPNTNTLVLNNKYLETVSVDKKVGNSKDANGVTSTGVKVTNATTNMSLGTISSSQEAQENGIGKSTGTIGVNEDRDYVGRWVGSNKRDLGKWTPLNLMTAGVTTTNIEDANEVKVEYKVDVYNIMKHKYVPKIGTDGIEYYEYTGTELAPGYYTYKNGKRESKVNDKSVTVKSNLETKDIGVNGYVDSKGFNNGTGQIAPAQFQVASEKFDDMGLTATGYTTESVSKGDAETVIKGTNTYKSEKTDEERPKVDYYEELAYAPYNTEDEVITQQAIPVGGRVAYVNPYEYFLLPSANGISVMQSSGETVSGIESKVADFKTKGKFNSEVTFNTAHTGFYVTDKDEFDTFNMAGATATDKTFMNNALTTSKQYKAEKATATGNYKAYLQGIKGRNSSYTTAGAVQSASSYKYKQPITYAHGIKGLLLEDVVAVGQDTGFPVIGKPETIQETYKTNYKEEFGVEPSKTDELVTTNNGSVYLIPLEKQRQKLSDSYRTRLFVNGIGISQVNLVDDNTLEFDKYLYGRGNNTIYSGQRQEVEVGKEFKADQTIGKNAKPEKTTQVNGVRTGNNSKVNGKVLKDE